MLAAILSSMRLRLGDQHSGQLDMPSTGGVVFPGPQDYPVDTGDGQVVGVAPS